MVDRRSLLHPTTSSGGSVADPTSTHAFVSRYEPGELLGQGGMGEVRLFRDSRIGREIALKTIRLDRANSAELRARFLREALVQGRLEHPAIVPLYDLGLDADGNEFFTMKRITGRTLAEVLRALGADEASSKSQFPRNKLLSLFTQVCLAVEYAHSRGVVHRDLKPTNIMIGDFGEVYVLDWGVARLLEKARGHGLQEHTTPPTEQSQMLGTPGYMAPEQVTHADQVDELADVYALGAILFEILALLPLHDATQASQRLRTTLIGVEPRPSVRRPESESPPELDALCVRATQFDPRARCTSAREMADALENFLAGDRDLEARRTLSQKHAAVAAEAKQEALAGGPDSNQARVRALREAGRAIALDPTSPQAAGIVVTLLGMPPQKIPDEVRQELEAATATTSGAMARFAAFVGPAYAALALMTLWLGLRSWFALLLLLLSLMAASVMCLILGFSSRLYFGWGRHVVAVLLTLSVMAGSGIAGAVVFMPTFACSATVGLMVSALNARQRWIYFAMGLASIAIPFALEWAGIVPASYAFGTTGMTILPVMADLDREVPMRIFSIMLCLGAMTGHGYTVSRTMGVVSKLRLRAALQSWQLRQLAPGAE